MKDFPISQLRIVSIWFKTEDVASTHIANSPTRHMMHESQVDTFVRATIELHAGKGNPKVGPLNNLWFVTVSCLNIHPSTFWWCHPNLDSGSSLEGAWLNLPFNEERVWAHPKLIADERRAEEEEFKWD